MEFTSGSGKRRTIIKSDIEEFVEMFNSFNLSPDILIEDNIELQLSANHSGFNVRDLDALSVDIIINDGTDIEWKLKDDVKKEWGLNEGILRLSKGRLSLL